MYDAMFLFFIWGQKRKEQKLDSVQDEKNGLKLFFFCVSIYVYSFCQVNFVPKPVINRSKFVWTEKPFSTFRFLLLNYTLELIRTKY